MASDTDLDRTTESHQAEREGKPSGSGGWGSLSEVTGILNQEDIFLLGSEILMQQNKPDGYMCVSCSWAKPAHPHKFEFCENGAKATAWEITSKKTTPEFFAAHTVSELRNWSDHALEEKGRLTHPMRYDAASDKYVPVKWDEAFQAIGAELKALAPASVIFYTSGRASLETSYMFALFGRMYGSNNFPDSSNMCHESTSVALPKVIGVPVGTILLEDFETTDCIFFFGHNTPTNAPRMLHALQGCVERNVPIVVFNPLRERGFERFTNPQSPMQMIAGGTRVASQFCQVKAGGDIGACLGISKALIEADDEALATGKPRVLDHDFIKDHTHGFEDYAAFCRAQSWRDIEQASGLREVEMRKAAETYAGATAAMFNYGMGVTQHVNGVETVKMIVNLMLLRGNIGRPGAGILPIRGHSNVQGQRTVGISEKNKVVPVDKLKALYGFEPPKEDGLTTVDACKGIVDGTVKGFISLGGNFVRAIPDRNVMEKAWTKLRLSVQVLTKLNRSALIPGEVTYLLPCLGRIEIDRQATGPQIVSMEDSTTCIHASFGKREPVGGDVRSEPFIVAGMAKATLRPNPKVDWDKWVGDYSLVRDAIEATYPDQFKDFNARMTQPGGFPRPLPARQRKWKTPNGKANFTVPESFSARAPEPEDIFRLITLRADGQFNTTVYTEDDRFRGIKGGRNVVLMNKADVARLKLHDGDRVVLSTAADDGITREYGNLQVMSYAVPERCIVGYYPELNVLIPLWHYAKESKVPASKSIPVRVALQHQGP